MKVNMTNALVLNQDKHVLIIHNCKNGSDRYEFPGGKVRDNETLEETTIREFLEETGAVIKLKGIFGEYETDTPEGRFLCRTYFADIIQGIPRILETKKADFLDYVSYAELERLARAGTLVPNLVDALHKLKKIVA